jgi:hypothetical protein
MLSYYDRYQKGAYREVYQELQDLEAAVFLDPIYSDALAVAHAMMQRVRYNLQELLLPRLQHLGYQFGAGFLEHSDDVTEDEAALLQKDFPIFQITKPDVDGQITALKQLLGALPITLQAWYREINTVNFIGAFPASVSAVVDGCTLKRGYELDPLCIYPPDVTLQFIRMEKEHMEREQEALSFWNRSVQEENDVAEQAISLSWDGPSKYGYRGGFDYAILEPFNVFDGMMDLSGKSMSFVDYLRWCLQWGGFPGLEQLWETERFPLSQEAFYFLTRDLLPF